MPTLGFHVPDDSPLLTKVAARAKDAHDGKVSAYVRSVVERDLEGRAVGIPESAYSQSQIARWMDDEVALLKAAAHALTVLHGSSEQESAKAAKEMAFLILQATRRAPLAELQAAEDKPARKVTVQIATKDSIVNPERARKKQA